MLEKWKSQYEGFEGENKNSKLRKKLILKGYNECKTIVEQAPTEDVVKVIRCGKCKHSFDAGMSGMYCDHPDNIMPLGCKPDDYCSYGEREAEK